MTKIGGRLLEIGLKYPSGISQIRRYWVVKGKWECFSKKGDMIRNVQ